MGAIGILGIGVVVKKDTGRKRRGRGVRITIRTQERESMYKLRTKREIERENECIYRQQECTDLSKKPKKHRHIEGLELTLIPPLVEHKNINENEIEKI